MLDCLIDLVLRLSVSDSVVIVFKNLPEVKFDITTVCVIFRFIVSSSDIDPIETATLLTDDDEVDISGDVLGLILSNKPKDVEFEPEIFAFKIGVLFPMTCLP